MHCAILKALHDLKEKKRNAIFSSKRSKYGFQHFKYV